MDDDLGTLATADLAALRAVWSRTIGRPPKLRSVELLRLMLAWRLQARAEGGIDPDTRRALRARSAVQPEGQGHGNGAIFRRFWQGRMIEAIVEPDGFRWEGRLYPSLSALAHAATGTRWNGPRFFGLRKETLR